MLTRSERLRFGGLFAQAFEKGKTVSSKNLRLTYTKTLERYSANLPFVGFVVSKSYSKKAVARNRIKRQVREAYRLYRQDLAKQEELKQIGLLVISIKPSCAETNYHKLQEELYKLLQKTSLTINS